MAHRGRGQIEDFFSRRIGHRYFSVHIEDDDSDWGDLNQMVEEIIESLEAQALRAQLLDHSIVNINKGVQFVVSGFNQGTSEITRAN
jgi:hypothetical protein